MRLPGIKEMKQKFFEKTPENFETTVEEAPELLKEERSRKIEEARKKSEKFSERFEHELDDLEDRLREVEEFEDYSSRKVIEDVMENIASRRRKKVERLEVEESPVEIENQIGELLEDFQDLSRKEEAVLEEAVIPEEFQNALKDLENLYSELEEFLQKEFSVVERLESLEEERKRYRKLGEKIDNLEDEKADLETRVEETKNEVEEVGSKIEELKASERWEEYRSLEGRIGEEREKLEEKNSRVRNNCGEMERSLKKLIYQVENGDVDVKNLNVLKYVRDGEVEKLFQSTEVSDALEEAREKLPEVVDESQVKKFSEASGKLVEVLEDGKEDIEGKIQDLEDERAGFDVVEELERLEAERKEVEKKVERKRSELRELKGKVSRFRSERGEVRSEVERILGAELDAEVTVVD